MKHALTVDLEDWYHGLTSTNARPETWPSLSSRTEQTVELLLDLFAANQLHATFFVLGDLAQKCPGVIRRIAEAGHELGSHGFSHRPVHQLKPSEFKAELDRTTQLVQDISGQAVKGFRAPYFSIDQRCLWAFEVLAESGYQYDFQRFSSAHHTLRLSRSLPLPVPPTAGGRAGRIPGGYHQGCRADTPGSRRFLLPDLPLHLYPLVAAVTGKKGPVRRAVYAPLGIRPASAAHPGDFP